jgi:putative ABC transport system permease protein
MALTSAYIPARRGAAVDPAVVLREAADPGIERPVVRVLLALALLCALTLCLPLFSSDARGGFAQLTLVVLCAALATPAFVTAMRALLVPAVERAWGMPGRLGLDYVQRTLSRSTINVLALMVAVGMSFSVSSWLSSFERSLVRWASQVGTADLTVTRGSPIVDRRHVPLRSDAVSRVQRVEGVASVQRFRMLDEQIAGSLLRLVATDTDVFLRESAARGKGWEVVSGRPLAPGDLSAEPSLVLSENAAQRLHVSAGDMIPLHTPDRGPISLRVRAVVVDFSSETGSAFLDLGFFHQYFSDDAIDSLFVYLAPGRDSDDAADAVRRALSTRERDDTIFVTKTSSLERHLLDTLRRAFSYSMAVELMTLIIGLMGVVGTMVAAVLDRKHDIRVLRAVGATRAQVACALVVEAAFLGLCAATAGILVGVAETLVFFKTLVATETGWHLTFVFPWFSALRTTLLVVATSALAGLIPAYRALRGGLTAGPIYE